MSGYVVSPKGDEDIFEIWRYLDETNPGKALTEVEDAGESDKLEE